MSRFGFFAASVLFMLTQPFAAHARSIPVYQEFVVDEAGLLGHTLQQQLVSSLRQFQRQHGPQIQLLTVSSLEGEPVENFSIRVADEWKLGDEKKDDGVLLLVALNDRAVRIEVGQGLEGSLPDITAGRIIREEILPHFQRSAYDAGVISGLQAIAAKIGGPLEALPARRVLSRPKVGGGGSLLFPILLFFFLFPRFFGGGRGFGRTRRRSIWGGVGAGLGGFGGLGSGGFSRGGGGGGFSGGGASGRW